ncbi:AAA family ATPase [Pectobacterium versatile]|uniref:AAA family ATPase n=1 Tax=Pectobacterium versatile TaxID=2488639 RepID=UPI001F1C7546|nr:AAA family ATPase [Pectobacterium versatile]
MNIHLRERQEALNMFLQHWPYNRLAKMTLEEYTDTGNKETLAWWLEFGPGRHLGSNAGGDASKFGIYMRAAPPKGERDFILIDETYSWKKKYGSTAEEAFATVKKKILFVLDAIGHSDLETIQQLDFETSLKWKLAFIYQDHNHPLLLSIYQLARLRELCGVGKINHATAYSTLMAHRGETPVLEYGIKLWKQVDQAEVDEDDEPNEYELAENLPDIPPLNQILYGPPGTGKTYSTINKALEILDPQLLSRFDESNMAARRVLKARFDEFVQAERIAFVTFHQSFSYEDFVEGIRARVNDSIDGEEQYAQLSYCIEDGIFKSICNNARRERATEEALGIDPQARIWKISIEEVNSNQETRQYCFTHGEARIGWEKVGDLTAVDLYDPALDLGRNDRNSLTYFSHEAKPGDILLCLASVYEICAVGVVEGPYEYQPEPPAGVRTDYVHRLPVKWLLSNIRFNILPLNDHCSLRPMTMYPLWRINVTDLFTALRAAGHPLTNSAKPELLPHVLIIDEINRGNVSRIFGELITLIEAGKRGEEAESLEVILPYSKKLFSVPKNLWIIGTMNTADRSLSGLDIALRRRFSFIELQPNYVLLADVNIEHNGQSVNAGRLLETINQRIEVLLDRDHCIGHAIMLPLKKDPSLKRLSKIFSNQIIPLLQEYFFDDWERISLVLNDSSQYDERCRFISQPDGAAALERLFGAQRALALSLQDRRWVINSQAFHHIESYQYILGDA